MTVLDMVQVEPKHRFDTIMMAYACLRVADVLELRLDHAPDCLYYTLLATRGDEAFDMEYLEAGPEVWRVRVRKRRPHPEDAVLQEKDASCRGC